MKRFVDVEINGVKINHMMVMESKYPGFDPYAQQRFPTGTVIAFKSEKELTEEQMKAVFRNNYRGSIAVQWPLKEPQIEKKDFTPSPYQKDILNTLLNSEDHIFIEALAGSGKTSTLVWLLKEISAKGLAKGKKIIYLAFNKSIQEELKEKLAGTGIPALTTHGFCFSQILKKAYPNIKLESSVVRDAFMATLLADQGWDINRSKDARKLKEYELKNSVYQMIGYVKNWAICPNYSKKDGWLFSDEQKEIMNGFILDYEVETPEGFEPKDIIDRVCRTIYTQLPEPGQEIRHITFDDMLYFPLLYNLPVPKYDLVLTDESQDFNACQILMLEKLVAA